MAFIQFPMITAKMCTHMLDEIGVDLLENISMIKVKVSKREKTVMGVNVKRGAIRNRKIDILQ